MHIFDISDPTDPVLVGSVEISNRVGRPDPDVVGCGSHTITAVPDLDAGTLVVYNQSAGFCATGEQEAFHIASRSRSIVPGEPDHAAEHRAARGHGLP